MLFKRFIWALTRRKPMEMDDQAPTDLNRCLNTLDLTAMGVGATLGFGLYVLSGEVAAMKAGPGVVLSFMIAAVASTFSALCYAEFAAKVPKSGSAYAYSYITVGEFVAFIIGWNLTLEHVIGTASLARGYSGYLGSLFAAAPSPVRSAHELIGAANSSLSLQHMAMSNMTSIGHLSGEGAGFVASWAPEFLHGYLHQFDWLAFMLTMLVTGLLLLGVEVSSRFQITFATINLSVACFIFACGLYKADFHNWQLTKAEIPANAGEGGFLPFGWTGVIAGAGTCFFAFVGFDGIAATAEEVKNPRKAIPNSILWTSGIIFITYCFMATIQTLIWPYWDQRQAAPLPYIFDKLGMHFAKWTILVGVLAGLSTSFVGGFLPLPRILYAMARDGVIYRVLAVISKRFKVPIVATIVGGILIACLASMMEIDQLADMLSIGTLAAYSLVSISVLLLRYEFRENSSARTTTSSSSSSSSLPAISFKEANIVNSNNNKTKNSEQYFNRAFNLGDNLKQDLNGNMRKDSTASGNSGSSSSSGGFHQVENGSRQPIGQSTTSRSLISLFIDGTRGPANAIRRPDAQTTHVSRVLILMLTIVTTLLDYSLVVYGPTLYQLEAFPVTICSSLFISTVLLGYLLNRLPVAESGTNSFEVPLVPTIPVFSVIINTYLMLNLSVMTWIRFAVWMAIGFFIYFTYGIFKSTGYKDSRCD